MERNYSLTVGKTYWNRNGNEFLCQAAPEPGCYTMKRVKDNWTLEAHTITMYDDGTIEWDSSPLAHMIACTSPRHLWGNLMAAGGIICP